MGTRADFYVGKGKDATWIGSVGEDGNPQAVAELMSISPGITISSEDDWVESVAVVFAQHPEHTVPERGWPWPWDNSSGTDYTYTLDEGQVWVSCYGCPWRPLEYAINSPVEFDRFSDLDHRSLEFPDMSKIKNVRWDSGNAPMIFGQTVDGGVGLVNDEMAVLEETARIVDES